MPIQKKFKKYVEENGWNRSLIVSAPTTSGKTLVSEVFIENKCQDPNTVVIYIAPMISLLEEKKIEFSEILNPNIKMCNHVKQLTSTRPNLLMTTPEVLFEIIKTDYDSLGNLTLIVVDEGHLLASKNRGYVLDVSMTLLKHIF